MKTIKIDDKDIDTPIGLHCTQLDLLTNIYKVKLENLVLADEKISGSEKKAKLEEVEEAKNDLIEYLKLSHPTSLI